ncbi:hypothetical protein HMSSN036_39390 [Paenibacillus macerans]|nr:hypothetical protein HMSSN036_39390 [Paenibacillus macerans]
MELNGAEVRRGLFLAAVCSQTYAQFSNEDGSFVLPPGYSLFDTIEAKSFIGVWERFGFILQSPEEIVIAFRGTSSTTNWIADAIASQKAAVISRSPPSLTAASPAFTLRPGSRSCPRCAACRRNNPFSLPAIV